MGSEYSPEIYDITLFKYDKETILPNNPSVVSYMRYRDDVLRIFDGDEDQAGEFVQSLRRASNVDLLSCLIRIFPPKCLENALDTAKVRRLKQLPTFCRKIGRLCRSERQKSGTVSNVDLLPCLMQFTLARFGIVPLLKHVLRVVRVRVTSDRSIEARFFGLWMHVL